ncbi:hypothetical protein O181_033345 [Austropuccinia psidii MF-1]|uniref:Uncharacterized protein n=1 Tax=Austropuccinia psidii MF-1 TaxID=1389203 RepID=A0A9Q3H957_9BASI|nr:hypothetical protein [Austropuccinia psidii MF-1]
MELKRLGPHYKILLQKDPLKGKFREPCDVEIFRPILPEQLFQSNSSTGYSPLRHVGFMCSNKSKMICDSSAWNKSSEDFKSCCCSAPYFFRNELSPQIALALTQKKTTIMNTFTLALTVVTVLLNLSLVNSIQQLAPRAPEPRLQDAGAHGNYLKKRQGGYSKTPPTSSTAAKSGNKVALSSSVSRRQASQTASSPDTSSPKAELEPTPTKKKSKNGKSGCGSKPETGATPTPTAKIQRRQAGSANSAAVGTEGKSNSTKKPKSACKPPPSPV